jgi:SOS response associated peptidase (SRAP)
MSDTGERSLDRLRWGLIPSWCTDPNGGRKPINTKSETVAQLPTFHEGYRKRRCIVPLDGFYEWVLPRAGGRSHSGRPLGLIAQPGGRLARLCDYLRMVENGELAGASRMRPSTITVSTFVGRPSETIAS